MSDRDKIIEVLARALVRRRIEFNHMDETKGRDPDWLQRAEDSTWEYFKTDAEVVCAALDATNLAVVPVETVETLSEHIGALLRILEDSPPQNDADIKRVLQIATAFGERSLERPSASRSWSSPRRTTSRPVNSRKL